MGATCSKSGVSSARLSLLSAESMERFCELEFQVCSWVLGEGAELKHVSISQSAGAMYEDTEWQVPLGAISGLLPCLIL